MSKSVVTLIFIGGVVAMIAGFVISAIAVMGALAGGLVVIDAGGIVGVDGSVVWAMLGPVLLGGVAIAGGALAGLIAWLGALVNTYQLEDKTWFLVLLVLGLFSFGFLGMIAYIFAGPDSTRTAGPRPAVESGSGA
ncbi:MAG TPA: hypothetical protein VFV72_08595 [Candidatus Limnocylindrales bacterium]|nr:hypothetical protein [Candidatus Limnocylindrales bacterium]